MNERTHFIKICISHTLFSKGLMFLLCVSDGWKQGQTAILTQFLLLTIARSVIFKNPLSTSSASWLGFLNRRSLWATALSLQAGPHSVLTLAFLSSTNSTAAGTCLYSFITPTCFRFFFRLFTQVHLWLTARSRVNIQHEGWYAIKQTNQTKQVDKLLKLINRFIFVLSNISIISIF